MTAAKDHAVGEMAPKALATGAGAVAAGRRAWVVLAVWAVVGPVLAAKFFRWE